MLDLIVLFLLKVCLLKVESSDKAAVTKTKSEMIYNIVVTG